MDIFHFYYIFILLEEVLQYIDTRYIESGPNHLVMPLVDSSF